MTMCMWYLISDQSLASALVSHFGGIVVLYLLQTSLILVCSPAGCRFHGSEMLEGFNLGGFLDENRKTRNGPTSSSSVQLHHRLILLSIL